MTEESDVEQYLKEVFRTIWKKFKLYKTGLNELKAKENEMRLKDLTFEKAFRYLPKF